MFLIKPSGELPFSNEAVINGDRFVFQFEKNEAYDRVQCYVLIAGAIVYAGRLQYVGLFNLARTGTALDNYFIFPVKESDLNNDYMGEEYVTIANFPEISLWIIERSFVDSII